MAPPLVLDSNALVTRGFGNWLKGYHGAKVLPAVAYAELGVHFGRFASPESYLARLKRSGIEVEWLDRDLAGIAWELGVAQGDWAERAMDYLIGAHAVASPRLLVTNNARDFRFLGARVRTPAQVMAAPPR